MTHPTHDNEKKTLQLLDSDFLTAPTKIVLKARLNKTGSARFFDPEAFKLLTVICDLLMNQTSENPRVNMALFIDDRLHHHQTNGWRYDCMPPDRIMYEKALKAVAASSREEYGQKFLELPKHQQLEMLNAIQNGAVDSQIWSALDPQLFFEELLAEATSIFFSHPTVQTRIKYAGMGDAKGWYHLKLNQSENLEKRL